MTADTPLSRRPFRILVAEDEAITSMTIEDVVENLGCTVVGPAGRMADALEVAKEAALEGAVLDVNLHGQQIYPVADILAKRGIPFMFLTGYGAQGLPPGHAHRRVLSKPFRASDLSQALADEFGLGRAT
jgi:CheY-like chemotaxis protein